VTPPAGSTSNAPEFRIGLVGCGRLAERGYLPAAERADGVRIVAVADPDRLRRERLAPGLPGFGEAEALVAMGGVDGLVLATPAAKHLHDARIAADAGLHSLIEKPPAADAAEAAALARLDPVPMIGFNRRFEPAVRELAGALRGHASLDLLVEHRGRRRAWRPYVVDDDALLTLGPHMLDLVSWLTDGAIRSVRARETSENRAVLELELDAGRATLKCRLDRPHLERVEARGRGGQLIFRRMVGGLIRYSLARLGPAHQSPLVATLTRQLEAFAGACRGVPDPRLGSALDGVAVMAAIDAARQSAASGGSWQPVDHAGRDPGGNPALAA
jgi:predicted dehydrogenase